MSHIGKLEFQRGIISSPAKFYDMFKNNLTLFSSIHPESIKSVEAIEGDGKHVGSVRLWKYEIGGTSTVAKERIEAADDVNKSITFNLFEGDIKNLYKTFKVTYKFSTDGNSNLAKCLLEFEKANKDIPDPDHYLDFIADIFKQLDDHLLKA